MRAEAKWAIDVVSEYDVWFCVATDKEGYRLRSVVQWDDEADADWCADRLQQVSDALLEDVEESPAWRPWWPSCTITERTQ